jgi:hypothetical protein
VYRTSTGTAYERIRDALETGGHATIDTGHGKLRAQCPAHTSATPNSRPLAVADKEGRALLICHAGCDYTSVLDALGLTPRDLFNEALTRPAPCNPRPTAPRRPQPTTDTSRAYLRTLAERFGSLTAAGQARAETHHDQLCTSCRSTDPLGGPQWWGRFCADCVTGWAPADDITEQQRWNATKQAAEAISQTRDWKQVAQRVRTGQ